MSDDSDEALESEEEDENINPYPLEGKYKDEADREEYVSCLTSGRSSDTLRHQTPRDDRNGARRDTRCSIRRNAAGTRQTEPRSARQGSEGR